MGVRVNNASNFLFTNPNRPQSNKTQQGEVKKGAKFNYVVERVSYGNEIAAWVGTRKWCAKGGLDNTMGCEMPVVLNQQGTHIVMIYQSASLKHYSD